MKRRTSTLEFDNELLVDLTFHSLPASLLAKFAQQIVKPYYRGNMNAAVQDLLRKALAEQDFIFSHISPVRASVEA